MSDNSSNIERVLFYLKKHLLILISPIEYNNKSKLIFNNNCLESKDLIYCINYIIQNINEFKNLFSYPFFVNSLYYVKYFRNKWAHQSYISKREEYRFLDDCCYLLQDICLESEEYRFIDFQRRLLLKELNNDFNDYIIKHSDDVINWRLNSVLSQCNEYELVIKMLNQQILELKENVKYCNNNNSNNVNFATSCSIDNIGKSNTINTENTKNCSIYDNKLKNSSDKIYNSFDKDNTNIEINEYYDNIKKNVNNNTHFNDDIEMRNNTNLDIAQSKNFKYEEL